MKIWKGLLKGVIIVLFLIAFLLPAFLLLQIAHAEQEQYVTAEDVVLTEHAYGEICSVERMNLKDFITISGKIVSTKELFVEMSQYEHPEKIRLLVSEGDVLREGDVIGYYQGKEIFAEKSGVLRRISLGSDGYLLLESITDIALEVYADSLSEFKQLTNGNAVLTDQDGIRYTVYSSEVIPNDSGTRKVLLDCSGNEDLSYGVSVDDMVLYTGKVYQGMLVAKKQCVYSYKGDSRFFVRIVSKDGAFLEEKEVTCGTEWGEYVSISGVEEGTLLDSGYGLLAGGE